MKQTWWKHCSRLEIVRSMVVHLRFQLASATDVAVNERPDALWFRVGGGGGLAFHLSKCEIVTWVPLGRAVDRPSMTPVFFILIMVWCDWATVTTLFSSCTVISMRYSVLPIHRAVISVAPSRIMKTWNSTKCISASALVVCLKQQIGANAGGKENVMYCVYVLFAFCWCHWLMPEPQCLVLTERVLFRLSILSRVWKEWNFAASIVICYVSKCSLV